MRRWLLQLVAILTTVTVTPPFGYSPAPVRVRLTSTEVSVVARLQSIATRWNRGVPVPEEGIIWKVEPSARTSPTLAVARHVMSHARQLLSLMEQGSPAPTWIVVGRTQEFLRKTTDSIGCTPDLSTTHGEFLMGLTACGRRVIVINLTGYLFLRSTTQESTHYMETRREPPMSAVTYTFATRNISSLAHEWFHVARAKVSDGYVPDNEPAWFREGMAEITAGLSMVRAYPTRADYMEFHVVRIRRFMDWSRRCIGPLSAFRDGRTPDMCTYTRGAAAIELLLARHGGIARIGELDRDAARTGDFLAAFRRNYGMSMTTFEREADVYTHGIRLASS